MSRLSERVRTVASIVLVVAGAVLLLAGTVTFYVRSQVIDEHAFADRSETALKDERVRRVVGREITVNLVDRGSTDLVAARPLIESVVDAALQTAAFRKLFRAAAVQTNRVLFVRERKNVAFDVSDAAQVIRFGLRSVSPKLADQVPRELDRPLITLRDREFATGTLQFADHVRVLGLVLPLLALVALAGGVVVAPDRRIGVLRAGVAVGAVGVLLVIALLILRARILAGVIGEDELTDADVQGAVAGILEAFAGDLVVWGFLLGLVGIVVAGAAAALDPEALEDPGTRLRRRLVARPATPARRALRGAAILAVGIFVVLSPALALQLGAVLVGTYLAFYGTSELLAAIQRRGATRAREVRTRRRALATAGIAGVLATGALVALVIALTGGGNPARSTVPAGTIAACNGSRALCGLRLNEAVFAGTHNSFSAADSPGWFIANQRRTIGRQLKDGIRLFLIDPHYGVADARGRVRTDFAAEQRDRNRVAKGLPPATLAAAERLAGSLGVRSNQGGKRDVWLCHTVCELGATRMVDSLRVMRTYLDRNRGEVVILFIEPYVPPREIARTFAQAGLDRYVATLARDKPLPTLGQLVRANRRVVVFTERDADGTVPWYLDGFSFVQDTPLGATRRAQLSCRRNRGTADSPLLMLNHWADVFPPSRSKNVPFQREDFILARARRCARERGLPANLIAVDHYDLGGLIPAVAELNAAQVRTVARERRTLALASAPGS